MELISTKINFVILILLHASDARDNCNIEPSKRTTPTECTIDEKTWSKWIEFSKREEAEGTALIRGKLDPFDCITPTEDPFTAVLERTGRTPFDLFTFYIIVFPIICGAFILAVSQVCRLEIKQDTSRDKYGFKVKSYPILPVSMLQESEKDKEFKRIKRNTASWICQKWFFYTNDIIREIPTEDAPVGSHLNPWEKVRFLARVYTLFRQTTARKRDLEATNKKVAEPKALVEDDEFQRMFPSVKLERKIELQRRQPQLKKLWLKLNEWMDELPEREAKRLKLKEKKAKLRKKKGQVEEVSSDSISSYGDSQDSYWGSSETYSSDHQD